MLRRAALLAALFLLSHGATGCGENPFPTTEELDAIRALHSLPSVPVKDATNKYALDPKAAALGTTLFHDPSLSSCGTVSCNSCHGNEGRTVSEAFGTGCGGQKTGRNPPTVLNAAYDTFFMWDGRADRLWSQAILPLTSPVEMGATPALLRERLDAGYAAEYADVFGKPVVESTDNELLANFGKAIAAYEWTLKKTESQYDKDVRRFIAAADRNEAESDPLYLAMKTFVRKAQCIACHKGPLLSDGKFHVIGVADESKSAGAAAALPDTFEWIFNAAGPYSDDRTGADANRLANFKKELESADGPKLFEGAFRTPSLRNVTLTGPFMHTGKLTTLAEVVDFYDEGGDADGSYIGVKTETIKKLDLTDEEKAALIALLESLTAK